jgi:hypothetical protein
MSGSLQQAKMFWGRLNLGDDKKLDNCNFCQFWPLGLAGTVLVLGIMRWLLGF